MDTYIEYYNWESNNNITFKLSTGKLITYEFRQYSNKSDRYYLRNTSSELNRVLFDDLGIENPYQWAENILGYRLNNTGWPEARSKEDIKKTIDALLKYNNPKYTVKKDFIVEDYPILPSQVRSFYSDDKKDVTFKELNVTYRLHPTESSAWWSPKDDIERKESYIFTQLKIKDKNKWVEKILGYRPCGDTGETAFPEAKTKADAYKVMDAIIAEYIKHFKLKTKVNYGDSKIELRRKKVDVRVGSCPAGSIVYGKRSKTAVRSRRISDQTCIGS